MPTWLDALLIHAGGMVVAGLAAWWFIRRFIAPEYRDGDR